MNHFSRPATPTIGVKRTAVATTCPACGGVSVARYPVLAEEGWLTVVKCQTCLHSIERKPGHRLGSIRLLSESL